MPTPAGIYLGHQLSEKQSYPGTKLVVPKSGPSSSANGKAEWDLTTGSHSEDSGNNEMNKEEVPKSKAHPKWGPRTS